MDATAQLALLVKAQQVFGSEGHFLSFPALSPYAYPAGALDFSNALADPDVRRALAEFSGFVNAMPGGTLFDDDGSRLWQAYDTWLSTMVLAEDNLTGVEQEAYDGATAFLTVTDGSGLVSDSPIVVIYKQCRDAWYSAVQNYKAAETSVTNSGDATKLQVWRSTDEPKQRVLVDAAASAWAVQGRRADVEAAQQVVANAQAASPGRTWQEWRKGFDPALDLATDPSTNLVYAPTGIAPGDLVEGDWPTFRLSGQEISALVQAAPPELRGALGESQAATTLASLSFEFRSVSVVRPWFRPDVFQARFWEFGDGTPLLSDGASPPGGSWPSYITGVVLARNIIVAERTAPQVNQSIFRFPPLVAKSAATVMPARPMAGPAQRAVLVQPVSRVDPAPAVIRPGGPPVIAMKPAMSTVAPPRTSSNGAAPPPLQVAIAQRLNAAIFRAPIVGKTPATPAPGPGPTPTTPPGLVSILAFICRRLPKTPDPDPGRVWKA